MKYFILASLTLLCCMFCSCSSDKEAEKELDLTGTWYLSSYDECEDEDVTTVTIPKEEATIKKILVRKNDHVYNVISMQRHIKPNELGHLNYENPQYGDWEKVANETYIFKDNKLYTDYIEYDVISMDSKTIKLGSYVYVSAEEPNLKKYLTVTYSMMD